MDITFLPYDQNLKNRYSKSSAQILLRWSLQQGYSVIPKSLDTDHIRQNRQLDFTMADTDILQINGLFS